MSLFTMTAGLSETLHAEISPLGLRSIYFEPGYFRTAFLEQSHRSAYDPRIADYDELTRKANEALVGSSAFSNIKSF
jgi:hypothetical protein